MTPSFEGLAGICKSHQSVLVDTCFFTGIEGYSMMSTMKKALNIPKEKARLCWCEKLKIAEQAVKVVIRHGNIETISQVTDELLCGMNKISSSNHNFQKYKTQQKRIVELISRRCFQYLPSIYEKFNKETTFLRESQLSSTDYNLLVAALASAHTRGITALITGDVLLLDSVSALNERQIKTNHQLNAYRINRDGLSLYASLDSHAQAMPA